MKLESYRINEEWFYDATDGKKYRRVNNGKKTYWMQAAVVLDGQVFYRVVGGELATKLEHEHQELRAQAIVESGDAFSGLGVSSPGIS